MSVVQGKLLVVGGYDAVKDEYLQVERERVQLGLHTGEPFTDSQIRCRQHRLQEVVDSGWWFQWRSTGQSGHFELRDVRPVALAEHAPPTTHVRTPVNPLPKPDEQRSTVVPRQHEQGVWPKRTETSVLHLPDEPPREAWHMGGASPAPTVQLGHGHSTRTPPSDWRP